MDFKIETNRAAFESRLQMLENTLEKDSGAVINENVSQMKKSGFWWCLLSLLKPFYDFFGKDVYSHVRADCVAHGIFKYCEVNKKFFSEDVRLLEEIKNKILTVLDKRTSNKYHEAIAKAIVNLDLLKPPAPAVTISCPPIEPAASIEDWVWPSDNNILGLTAESRTELNHALSALADNLKDGVTIQKPRKKFRFLSVSHPQGVRQIPLPLNLTFLKRDDQVIGILLHTKRIVGKGGERTVKLCYNVTTGRFFAKKRLSSRIELNLLEYFQKYQPRGIAAPYVFRVVSSKTQVIEPLYDGPLTILFGTAALAMTEQKLSLMQDILHGLSFLHHCTIDEISYTALSIRKTIFQVKMFHFDIKPGNILVRKVPGENRWEAVITDFGAAGQVTATGGTAGYKAPEEMKLQLKVDPRNHGTILDNTPAVEHNLRYGQAMDIWSTGIVFVEVASGRLSTRVTGAPIPPLPCIEECFLTKRPQAFYEDENIANLTQKQIDQDLLRFKNAAQCLNQKEALVLDKIWSLISTMLRIKAEERISAANALGQL